MTTIDNKPLVLDLVEWVAVQPRAYVDVMDAWRTSCPRLTIWEDSATGLWWGCIGMWRRWT